MSGSDEPGRRRRRRLALIVALPLVVCVAATAGIVTTLDGGYTSSITVGLVPEPVLDELAAVRGVPSGDGDLIPRADLVAAAKRVPRRPWMRGRVLDQISIARTPIGRELTITARGPDRPASERLVVEFTGALAGHRRDELDRVVRELRRALALETRVRVDATDSLRARLDRASLIAPLEGGGLELPDPLRASESRPVRRPVRDIVAASILGLMLSFSALAYRTRARGRARP